MTPPVKASFLSCGQFEMTRHASRCQHSDRPCSIANQTEGRLYEPIFSRSAQNLLPSLAKSANLSKMLVRSGAPLFLALLGAQKFFLLTILFAPLIVAFTNFDRDDHQATNVTIADKPNPQSSPQNLSTHRYAGTTTSNLFDSQPYSYPSSAILSQSEPPPLDFSGLYALLPLLCRPRQSRRIAQNTPTPTSFHPPSRRAKYQYGDHNIARQNLPAGTPRYHYGGIQVVVWPSRDPIWERGGINLYAMVGNDVVSWWDYLGLIDINFNPKGVDSEGKREGCMSEFAKNAPDSVSDMTVFGHGSPNGIRNDRDPSKPVLWEGEAGVKALADEIRNHQDWKDGKIKRVVLYSCETGRSRALNGQIPFAQKLADELGIVILAPNEILWCSKDGSSSVCCKLDSVYKDDKRPDPNRPGDWMKFEKGKDPIKGDPPSKKNLEDAPRIPQSKDPNP